MNTSFRKKWKIFLLSLSIVLSLVALFFVTLFIATEIIRSRPYPFENAPRWVSSDPYFVLDYRDVDDELIEHNAVLEINGELQEVDVGCVGGTYDVFIIDPETGYTETLFGGSWWYRGDNLVFRIKHDRIFNGDYKEIVFEPDNGTEQNTQLE